MKDPVKHYSQIRLAALKEALEANHFEVHVADHAESSNAEELDPPYHPDPIGNIQRRVSESLFPIAEDFERLPKDIAEALGMEP